MTITAGQQSALRDLESVAREGDALEVMKVVEPRDAGESLLVEIALSFKGLPQTSDGIPLRQRERFFIFVPGGYPLRYPHVWVPPPAMGWLAPRSMDSSPLSLPGTRDRVESGRRNVRLH